MLAVEEDTRPIGKINEANFIKQAWKMPQKCIFKVYYCEVYLALPEKPRQRASIDVHSARSSLNIMMR